MGWSGRKAARSTRKPRPFELDIRAILRERPFEAVLAAGQPAYVSAPEGMDGILKVYPDGRRELVTFDLQGEHLIAVLPSYKGPRRYSVKPRLGRPPDAADGG